jgi:hypothetical protein
MDSLPFDLNNLHFFVLVVERRGFTAAADATRVEIGYEHRFAQ